MAKQKSRFPSYGLVRGASHEHGGVAGMVAGEHHVEHEGGEWIIPKEAVPDYLPVLKQITNEGRAMQQMDNGNTAMDALIASASMENGITQPKSPMYQEGGQVEPSILDYLGQLQGVQQKYQGDIMTGAGASKYNPEGMLTKEGLSELYNFPLEQMTLDTLMAGPRTRKITIKGPEREAEHLQTLFGVSDKEGDELLEKSGIRKQLSSAYPTESSRLGYLMGDAGKAIKALDAGYLDMDMFKRMDWERKNKEQGGPIYNYQEGGEVSGLDALSAMASLLGRQKAAQPVLRDGALQAPVYTYPEGHEYAGLEYSVAPPTAAEAFGARALAEKESEGALRASYGLKPKYQTGGQIQPRKQQEIRNPQVYGPPAPANMDSVLKQIMMRDVNQSINPFTGDSLDMEGDSLRLLQRMKKSKMPVSGRKNMYSGGPVMYQQGGPVMYANGGQLGEGQPLSSEFVREEVPQDHGGYFPLASQAEPGALMGSIRSDRRIKPLQPDTYYQKLPLAKPFDKSNLAYPSYQEEVEEVPKLSTAYLASFGMETPLSRKQGALLYRKGIAPQTLNPQVKGLINRALVQRLTNEDD